MALKAGRVGVSPSEVDVNGKIKGGGSTDVYTKEETNAEINKVADNIDIKYNSDTGKPEWRERGADTFNPFSSGVEIDVLYTGSVGEHFTSKVIEADFSKYDYIVIQSIRQRNSDWIKPHSFTMFKREELLQLSTSYKPAIVGLEYTRPIDSFTNNKLTLGNGMYGSVTDPTWCIPIAVYGVNGLSF